MYMRIKYQGPFCQRNEPPRRDPPGSSCSHLPQKYLLWSGRTRHPLNEKSLGVMTRNDRFMCNPVDLYAWCGLYGLLSYSGECPQLWTPSETGWPTAESHRLAAAGYSQCRLDRHLPLFSPPATWEREPMRESEWHSHHIYMREEEAAAVVIGSASRTGGSSPVPTTKRLTLR